MARVYITGCAGCEERVTEVMRESWKYRFWGSRKPEQEVMKRGHTVVLGVTVMVPDPEESWEV